MFLDQFIENTEYNLCVFNSGYQSANNFCASLIKAQNVSNISELKDQIANRKKICNDVLESLKDDYLNNKNEIDGGTQINDILRLHGAIYYYDILTASIGSKISFFEFKVETKERG